MPTYDVTVSETVVRRRVFRVEAYHESDAEEKAFSEAANSDFDCLPIWSVEQDAVNVKLVDEDGEDW